MPTTLNRLLTLAADTDLMKDADLTPNELLSRGLVHAKLKKVDGSVLRAAYDERTGEFLYHGDGRLMLFKEWKALNGIGRSKRADADTRLVTFLRRETHTASLPLNLSVCLMPSLSQRMTSFRSGRSNQGMAPAIASTTSNTALWLHSAPLANVLVANANGGMRPARLSAHQPGTTTPIYAHESPQAAFCAASESLFLINRGS